METIEAKVLWVENMHFVGQAEGGPAVSMDAKPEGGGQRRGLTPMELLLVALGGCTAMDVISILKKKRQNPQRFEVHLRGMKKEEHPRAYQTVEITYHLWGSDLDYPNALRALELSEEKYCAVGASLKEQVEIKSSLSLHSSAPGLIP